MSKKFNMLHSHSGLEKELGMPKHIVLVDEQYKGLFIEDKIKPISCHGINYYKVPILSFVRNGGVFKNFTE